MKTIVLIMTAFLIFSCEGLESKKSKLQQRINKSKNVDESQKEILQTMLLSCNTQKCYDSVRDLYTELSAENIIKESAERVNDTNEEQNQGWEYSSNYDKMKDDTTYYATIKSKNYVNLDFPYNGMNYAYITLRKNKKSSDILIQVEKGQFNTDYRGTYFYFKFDDNERKLYQLIEPESRESTILFVDKVKDFTNSIKQAKELLLEAKFYNNGNFVFEFDVEDLSWE